MIYPPGNDVVDLHAPDNRRSADNPRYARRVLSPTEHAQFLSASAPWRLLWLLWSAKEAAYKSLSPDGSEVFSQRQFEVEPEHWSDLRGVHGEACGEVVLRDRKVPVRWHWNSEYVHCVSGAAAIEAQTAVRELDAFEPAPRRSEHYAAMPRSSQAVRALAHELLDGMTDVPHGVWLSRRSRHAPQLVIDAQVWPGAQVSLSHDGRFVAVAAIGCQ